MRTLLYMAILLVITGCSCSSPRLRELDEAQRMITEDPQAALDRLNVIDVSEFSDSATMARWALLYSEAMVANNLSAPTDTIINIAVDYYERHNERAEFQQACRLKTLITAGDKKDALASALYLQKEKEFMLYNERVKRERLMTRGLLAIALAAGVIVWQRQRLKIKTIQNDALMAEASGLKCMIDVRNKDVDKLESTLHRLLDGRFALIDSLCQTYYESQGTKSERKAIADKVKSEIEAVSSDSFGDMERAVNDCCNNLLVGLKEICPDIKADDYKLAVFLASRLSTRTISLLLGESVDVVYKRKSRLKMRVKAIADNPYPQILEIF